MFKFLMLCLPISFFGFDWFLMKFSYEQDWKRVECHHKMQGDHLDPNEEFEYLLVDLYKAHCLKDEKMQRDSLNKIDCFLKDMCEE